MDNEAYLIYSIKLDKRDGQARWHLAEATIENCECLCSIDLLN